MFKMGCSMAKKILAIDKSAGAGASGSSSGVGAGSSSHQESGQMTKKSKDKQQAFQQQQASEPSMPSKTGKPPTAADGLNDFSKLEHDPRNPLNVRQIFKITKSWKAIARTMSKTGTAMFLNLFEQNQDLFYLFTRFQHLKGKELHESTELKDHASTVMSTLDQAINSLSDYDNFVTYLHSIGKLHRKVPGFNREHFWKIEQPFLKAVKQTLDERCNETIEEIYKIAIKLIIETIADGYGQDGGAQGAAGTDEPSEFGAAGGGRGASEYGQGTATNGGGGGSNGNSAGSSGANLRASQTSGAGGGAPRNHGARCALSARNMNATATVSTLLLSEPKACPGKEKQIERGAGGFVRSGEPEADIQAGTGASGSPPEIRYHAHISHFSGPDSGELSEHEPTETGETSMPRSEAIGNWRKINGATCASCLEPPDGQREPPFAGILLVLKELLLLLMAKRGGGGCICAPDRSSKLATGQATGPPEPRDSQADFGGQQNEPDVGSYNNTNRLYDFGQASQEAGQRLIRNSQSGRPEASPVVPVQAGSSPMANYKKPPMGPAIPLVGARTIRADELGRAVTQAQGSELTETGPGAGETRTCEGLRGVGTRIAYPPLQFESAGYRWPPAKGDERNGCCHYRSDGSYKAAKIASKCGSSNSSNGRGSGSSSDSAVTVMPSTKHSSDAKQKLADNARGELIYLNQTEETYGERRLSPLVLTETGNEPEARHENEAETQTPRTSSIMTPKTTTTTTMTRRGEKLVVSATATQLHGLACGSRPGRARLGSANELELFATIWPPNDIGRQSVRAGQAKQAGAGQAGLVGRPGEPAVAAAALLRHSSESARHRCLSWRAASPRSTEAKPPLNTSCLLMTPRPDVALNEWPDRGNLKPGRNGGCNEYDKADHNLNGARIQPPSGREETRKKKLKTLLVGQFQFKQSWLAHRKRKCANKNNHSAELATNKCTLGAVAQCGRQECLDQPLPPQSATNESSTWKTNHVAHKSLLSSDPGDLCELIKMLMLTLASSANTKITPPEAVNEECLSRCPIDRMGSVKVGEIIK